MKPSEILKSALELLDNGNAWTKGSEARDAYGEKVCSTSPDAVSFCAVGALWKTESSEELGVGVKVELSENLKPVRQVLERLVPDGSPLPNFNDDPSTTFEDISLLFKKAITETEYLESHNG